jgi:hypothetical protein
MSNSGHSMVQLLPTAADTAVVQQQQLSTAATRVVLTFSAAISFVLSRITSHQNMFSVVFNPTSLQPTCQIAAENE